MNKSDFFFFAGVESINLGCQKKREKKAPQSGSGTVTGGTGKTNKKKIRSEHSPVVYSSKRQ
jgi:hypothetical protein